LDIRWRRKQHKDEENRITKNLMTYSPTKYHYCDQIKQAETVRHVAHTVENRKTYRVLVKKPEGKRQHGRSRHRWEDKRIILQWMLRK
jgi:hypothetical protein